MGVRLPGGARSAGPGGVSVERRGLIAMETPPATDVADLDIFIVRNEDVEVLGSYSRSTGFIGHVRRVLGLSETHLRAA